MPTTQELNYRDPVSGRIDAGLPLIDVAALSRGDWQYTVTAAKQACEEFGFLCLQLEPRSCQALDSALTVMRHFFAQDDERKAPYRSNDGGHGWSPPFQEPAYQPGTFSNVESFDIARESFDRTSGAAWPRTRDFRLAVEACWAEYLRVGDAVLELLARATGVAPGFFASHCNTRELNTFRLLHYPESADTPNDRDVGIAAHTDFECITLLYQTAPGLELRRPDGRWVDAPTSPGTMIVLLDDMLETWTNGRLVATGHRVRRTQEERFSVVMFFAVDEHVTVSPLPEFVTAESPARYPATRQADHIDREMERARRHREAASVA